MTEGLGTGAAPIVPRDPDIEPALSGVTAERRARDVARLWATVLPQLADRAAHEIRGALNGVAVNLEVARSRTARGTEGTTPVGAFLANAAEQLEMLTERTEALLALSRRAPRPLDVHAVVERIVALLGPAARATGGTVVLDAEAADCAAVTSADPDAARLAVAGVLLAASDGHRRVVCRIAVPDAIILRVEGAEGTLAISPDIVRAAADAGIGIEQARDATIVTFPA